MLLIMQTAASRPAVGPADAAGGRAPSGAPPLEPNGVADHLPGPDLVGHLVLDSPDRSDDDLADQPCPADDAADGDTDDADHDGDVDPFSAFADEEPDEGAAMRAELLSKRGYFPLRKEFVQRRRQAEPDANRHSVLHELVQARQPRALMALLLAHAIAPTLQTDPFLPLATWARMLSTPTRPCSSTQASAALNVLHDRELLVRTDRGRQVQLTLLTEDGTKQPWERAGLGDVGPGFFIVPHTLFSDGLFDNLNLPGLAMLLLALHETNQKPVFNVAVDKLPRWYGLSERTGERGYRELIAAGIMKVHVQKVRDGRSPTGLRRVHHRMLVGAYGTESRRALQQQARRAARATAAPATAPAGSP